MVYKYPKLDASGKVVVDINSGKYSVALVDVDIKPAANWTKIKAALKGDEASLLAALSALGITDATHHDFVAFLKKLRALPAEDKKNVLKIIEAIKKNNPADKDKINEGHVFIQQEFGVGAYSLAGATPVAVSQQAQAIDLGRKMALLASSNYYLPVISDDRKKFLIGDNKGASRTYYDPVNLKSVKKADYDDFFARLEAKYAAQPEMLAAIAQLKGLLKISSSSSLPDTKKINALLRFIFAPEAFQTKAEKKVAKHTPTSGPKSYTPWGRAEKKPFWKRVGSFFATHWLATAFAGLVIAAGVIGILALTAPASIGGVIGTFAALGAKIMLAPQLTALLGVACVGGLLGLSKGVFKSRRQMRHQEIKAWQKKRDVERKLISEKSLINNRVLRLRSGVSTGHTSKLGRDIKAINKELSRSETAFEKMMSRLDKQSKKRYNLNTARHGFGVDPETSLNTSEVIRETTVGMNNTLYDRIKELEDAKLALTTAGKAGKAQQVQRTIDKMKALKAKVDTEHKRVFDDTTDTTAQASPAIKAPADVESEKTYRGSGRRWR